MAEAFLYQLLQAHNRVETKGERCPICLEEYGTLSRETGSLEVQIHLPCNHLIGSACIATWLKHSNSCPICRHEFFLAQPRPYLEHGIMDGDEYQDEDDQPNIRELSNEYCGLLALDSDVALISELIGQSLSGSGLMDGAHDQYCTVAVSVYVATYLTGEPRSPREIAAITGIDADHIRQTYDLIYPGRERLATMPMRRLLEDIYDLMGPLDWPAPGHELTDEQIENGHVWLRLKQGCEEGCDELGMNNDITGFTTQIAEKLCAAGLTAHLPLKELIAVSIYMASHIKGNPFPVRRLAEVVHLSEPRVHSAYQIAYAHQHILIGQTWLDGVGSIGGVSGLLPSPEGVEEDLIE